MPIERPIDLAAEFERLRSERNESHARAVAAELENMRLRGMLARHEAMLLAVAVGMAFSHRGARS